MPRHYRHPDRQPSLPQSYGRLAGTTTPHPYVGTGQCRYCYGWPDDYRHLGTDRG